MCPNTINPVCVGLILKWASIALQIDIAFVFFNHSQFTPLLVVYSQHRKLMVHFFAAQYKLDTSIYRL